MNVAIIPARIGSKRIPKKNIKLFLGKHMIAYPIETALSSKNIEKVIVSTDSEEIANIAIEFGAKVPFIRPKELSDDFTPTVPVIAHAIRELIDLDWDIDNVCCIYPCTPLLKSKDLDLLHEKMVKGKYPFAYPVVSYSHPIQRALRMRSDGKMSFFYPKHELTRTQDLEESYHDTGQFYWGSKIAWLQNKKMHTDGLGVKISKWGAVDIDNVDDWKFAELLKKTTKNE
jgi:pseudaminic acid cytidylyltransferase